ncbi:MAG: class I SAM-dependent methyltransferase [candidate division WWE3 bacterium]|nr:class I SAM-dependent methyltransferase [candidate division WWE3 bacterium]
MLNELLKELLQKRTVTVINRISPFIQKTDKIIDIGSGPGDIARILKDQGFNVNPVDVADFHGPRVVETTIYDGTTLPFPDKTFDKALLLMVLHHTPQPEIVFDEASRVATELVVIETSYTNPVDRFSTIIFDALGNLRLEAFWNSYKTDTQWRDFFTKKGFDIVNTEKYLDKTLGIFPLLHILYYLRRRIS